MHELTRRDVMRAAVVAGIGAALPAIARADESPAAGVLRIAHLTDMHVTDKDRGDAGYGAALRSVEQHKPALILTGGDHVMDAAGHAKSQAVAWFDLHDKVVAEHAPKNIPIHPCIGNHDVYGWTLKDAKSVSSDAQFGKAMALDRLKLKQRYYSFDRGGWHFVILDNVMRREPSYFGSLDAEQNEWLVGDLAANKLPTVVMTHIPLVSVTCILPHDKTPAGDGYAVKDSNMHHDVRPLLKLLSRNNVKLCLSGHMHQVDEVDYMGMKFCCNGAVSGSWWKGPYMEASEGYGVIDLHADGRVENRYVTYGWNAKT